MTTDIDVRNTVTRRSTPAFATRSDRPPDETLTTLAKWFAEELVANEIRFPTTRFPASWRPYVARHLLEPWIGWPDVETADAYLCEMYVWSDTVHGGCGEADREHTFDGAFCSACGCDEASSFAAGPCLGVCYRCGDILETDNATTGTESPECFACQGAPTL